MKLLHIITINGRHTIHERVAEVQMEIGKIAHLSIYNNIQLGALRLDTEAYETLIQFNTDIKQLKLEAKNPDILGIVQCAIGAQIDRLTAILNEAINHELAKAVE